MKNGVSPNFLDTAVIRSCSAVSVRSVSRTGDGKLCSVRLTGPYGTARTVRAVPYVGVAPLARRRFRAEDLEPLGNVSLLLTGTGLLRAG